MMILLNHENFYKYVRVCDAENIPPKKLGVKGTYLVDSKALVRGFLQQILTLRQC